MAKHELSIKATYLPGWGVYEGVRELIQNARDSELQFNAPMSVEFKERTRNGKKTGAIIIRNDNVTLPKEALLIGHTTKDNDSRLIGKFGEGLKFGVLALLRLGIEIKIKNGSEIWKPFIHHSETYDAKVLCFNVTGNHKNENCVQFEIIGVTEADWKTIKGNLLFLGDYPNRVECFRGNVLTEDSFKGKIFVKGMYVATNSNLHFGYDFHEADIDRDRRMISDLYCSTSSMLAEALGRKELTEEIFSLIEAGSDEANIATWELSEDAKQFVAAHFSEQHPDTIACDDVEQIRELEHYGKRGVKVPWRLKQILESVNGSAGDKIVALRKSEARTYTLDEISASERDNYRKAVTLVAQAQRVIGDTPSTDKIKIVDFNQDNLLGTYQAGDGTIKIAKKILNDFGRTLYTLIHEAAHVHGEDGFKTHEDGIGKLSATIFNEVLQ